MGTRRLPSRRRAIHICALAAVTAFACGALLSAAVLFQASVAALPFIAAICIGCPMAAGADLPAAVESLKRDRARRAAHAAALNELRSGLKGLPETSHPLGH